MKIRLKKDSLYKCYIFLLVLMYMLEATSWQDFNNSVFHNVLLLFVIFVAILYTSQKKFALSELIQFFLINLIGILCFLSSGNTGLFFTMLAITLLPDGYLDKVLRMIYREEVVLFVGIIIVSQAGLLNNYIMIINKGSYVANARTLGFSHPNMLAAQATSIVFLYLCINRENVKKSNIVAALIMLAIIFYFSQGRTSLLLGGLAVILIAIKDKKWLNKIILKILPWVYLGVFIILISCMAAYAVLGENAGIVKVINDSFFNGRIGLAYRSLLAYPITLFGKTIDTSIWNQWQYYSLDNGQVMILLEYGVVGFFAYFWIIQKTLKKIKDEKEIVFAIVIIVFLIWSMYEGTMYFIGKNFALLFLGESNLEGFKVRRKRGSKYDS